MIFGRTVGNAAKAVGNAATGKTPAFQVNDKYISQHDFNLQSEDLQGRIRYQRIAQFEYELEAEKWNTKTAAIGVQVAESKHQQAGFKLKAQQYKTEGAQFKAIQAQYQAKTAQIEAWDSGNQYQAAHIQANLQYQTLQAGLHNMNLRLGQQQVQNTNLETELKKAQLYLLSGEKTTFSSLVQQRQLAANDQRL